MTIFQTREPGTLPVFELRRGVRQIESDLEPQTMPNDVPQPLKHLGSSMLALALCLAPGLIRAEPIDACEALLALLIQMDQALTAAEAGTPISQVDMLQIKLASSRAKIGLSDADGAWPDPRTKPALDVVSAATKGRDGTRFDPLFAAETLQNEGQVLADGGSAGCRAIELPTRYENAK